MIVTPEGQFVTGRAHPRLVLVQPKIKNDSMTLSAPDMIDFVLDIPNLYTIPQITSSVWQQPIQAIDCGDEVAKWLSRFICNDEIGLRLVFYPNTVPTRAVRPKDLKYKTLKPIDSVRSVNFLFIFQFVILKTMNRVPCTIIPVLCC